MDRLPQARLGGDDGFLRAMDEIHGQKAERLSRVAAVTTSSLRTLKKGFHWDTLCGRKREVLAHAFGVLYAGPRVPA